MRLDQCQKVTAELRAKKMTILILINVSQLEEIFEK